MHCHAHELIVTCLDLTLDMPIVTVALYSGRSQTEKDRLAEAITEDISRILQVPKKETVVVYNEIPHGNWYSSGVRL